MTPPQRFPHGPRVPHPREIGLIAAAAFGGLLLGVAFALAAVR